MKVTFTLDTNCMLAVDENRDGAEAVKELLSAHHNGLADCAMVASSAAEMQRDRSFLDNLDAFNRRRTDLGFGNLELLPPIARFDMSFWNNALYPDEAMKLREQAIFEAMFPNSHYEWADFARSRGMDPEDPSPDNMRKWRNQLLDAQAFWAHQHNGREYFVTTDSEFRRLEKSGLAREGTFLRPQEAIQRLP